MAKIERTYNQEKAKQIQNHNVALLDYSPYHLTTSLAV